MPDSRATAGTAGHGHLHPFRAFAFALLLLLTPAICPGEWPSDVQLVFTGNLAGNAAAMSESGEIEPSACWSVPDLLRNLRRERGFATLAVGVGNDADIRSPLTVAGGGSIERAWAKDAGVDIQALGPSDLEACGTAPAIPADLLKRVWTNVSTADGDQVFPGWKRARVADRSVAVACLISDSRLADAPLSRWRRLKVEPPLHALNRMRAQAPDSDLKILVCHLDDADFAQIASAAVAGELVVRVSGESASSPKEAVSGGAADKPERYELGSGNASLLVIRRFTGSSARTDLEVRRLPLAKAGRRNGGSHLSSACPAVASGLHRPLRVITTLERADAPPYQPLPDTHARLVRRALRADIALVAIPSGPSWLRDRIITPASVFSAFENRRLRLYNLPGPLVRRLFFTLAHGSFSRRIGSDGVALSLYGGTPERLLVGGRTLDERRIFKVAVSEDLFDDPSLKSILGRNDLSGSRGMTLWDAWLGELPGLPRSFGIAQ